MELIKKMGNHLTNLHWLAGSQSLLTGKPQPCLSLYLFEGFFLKHN